MIERVMGLSMILSVVTSVNAAMAQDVVMADAYFEAGIKAMEAGNYNAACPDLAKSQKLDPKAGTLFALGDCERQRGRIATASVWFDSYLRQVAQMPDAKREKHAERVKRVERYNAMMAKEMPTLSIVLPPEMPSNAKVFRDGTELTETMLGVPLPIDPGEHVVQVDVAGVKWPEQRVRVEKGEAKRLEIQAPSPEPKPPDGPNGVHVDPVQKSEMGGSTSLDLPIRQEKKTNDHGFPGGWIVLGGGAIGLVTWGVTGTIAIQKKSAFDARCPNNPCRPGVDATDWYQARTLLNLATVGLGVGVVGSAVGVAMLLWDKRKTATRTTKSTMTVTVIESGSSGATVGIRGVF